MSTETITDPADTLKRVEALLAEYDSPGPWDSNEHVAEYADALTDEARRLVAALKGRHVVTVPFDLWGTFANGIIGRVLGTTADHYGVINGYIVEIGGRVVMLGGFDGDDDLLSVAMVEPKTSIRTGETDLLAPEELTWIAVR